MKKLLTFFAAAVTAVLVACSPSSPELDAIPSKQPITLEAIQSTAKGFEVGDKTNPKLIYVFFDAQCPHCGHLWETSKALWPNAHFAWIPVGILNKASAAQGGTLLASDSPATRMDEHEASLLAHQGGITAGTLTPEQKLAIEKNTKLFNSFGATSIPFIVTTNAQGKVVSDAGALPPADLAKMAGIFMTAPVAEPEQAVAPVAETSSTK